MDHRMTTFPPARRAVRPALMLAVAGCLVSAPRAAAEEVPPQTLMINELLAKTWSENSVKPSAKATPEQFVRRAYIDLIGRVPSSEEVREYLADSSPTKRHKLIHRLLHETKHQLKDVTTGKSVPSPSDAKKPLVVDYTEEYARHWANIWGVWLMTRSGVHNVYHDQMKLWLEDQFVKNVPYDEFVTKLLTATGETNKNQAVTFIASHLGDASPADKRITDGPFDAVPITSRVTRLFLGIQVQCTQCHDHPFNPEWKQDNFWGVNAFFRQVARDKTPTPAGGMGKKAMEAVQLSVSDDPNLNPSKGVFFELRSGTLKTIQPTFLPDLADLGAEKPSKGPKRLPAGNAGKSRRQVLAEYVVGHDNFAKAYVNRIWAHLFGHGMNEQGFDDFGGHNKVLHPELLNKLAEEFARYKYDTKALVEWICCSDAYNLSHVANETNKDPKLEPLFARMLLKSMSPEVLFESIMQATRADYDKEAKASLRDELMSKLVRNFGDDEGNEVTFNGTIVQALMLMNGKEINQEISRKSTGTVDRALTKYRRGRHQIDEKAVLDEVYLSALARRPSNAPTVESRPVKIDPRTKKEVLGPVSRTSEVQFIMSQLTEAKTKNAQDFARDPVAAYKAFYEDVLWSLLNTSEFILNH